MLLVSTMRRNFTNILAVLLCVFIVVSPSPSMCYSFSSPVALIKLLLSGGTTVGEAYLRATIRSKVKALFMRRKCSYPPEKVTFIALKAERRLELWASNGEGEWLHIIDYPIRGTSGTIGPKLREGDKQIPEGVYSIIGINPNSSFHLSMKLDYPNVFDRKMAIRDGRTKLGGNIFIHGSFISSGCLAMGDEAIEELFLIVQDVDLPNICVIIAPYDFRKTSYSFAISRGMPKWVPDLYKNLKEEIAQFIKNKE